MIKSRKIIIKAKKISHKRCVYVKLQVSCRVNTKLTSQDVSLPN